jgi:type IV pilus assembly protein PilB
MDFGNGIRSLMRQDPDVILVGEVRDEDTATMAFRAAMTGHQVYTTLHTNSAIGSFPRLIDIGIKPDILAGNIIGVIAQRLIRRLCKHCKQPYEGSAGECKMLGVNADRAPTIYRAVGCDHCDYQGYKGRVAIMEILKMDGELDEMVAHHVTARELHKAAISRGFKTLADDGIRRVLDGSTSIEELMRVVDLTDRM